VTPYAFFPYDASLAPALPALTLIVRGTFFCASASLLPLNPDDTFLMLLRVEKGREAALRGDDADGRLV
jgi:hypothetical protein